MSLDPRPMFWGVLLAIAFCILMAWSDAVHAQTSNRCAPRETVVERLANRFGESRRSIAIGGNNSVVETFSSKETGSWTITVTHPNGITCMVAAGTAFELVDEELPPKGEEG